MRSGSEGPASDLHRAHADLHAALVQEVRRFDEVCSHEAVADGIGVEFTSAAIGQNG
jgi:hypothetical protein